MKHTLGEAPGDRHPWPAVPVPFVQVPYWFQQPQAAIGERAMTTAAIRALIV
jgi:hypothetical protein